MGVLPCFLECLVHVGKVKRIDAINHPMQKTWSLLGYDTAWVPPHCGMVPSGLEEGCVRLWMVHMALDEHVMVLNVHHIATDGWSTAVSTISCARRSLSWS